MVRGPLYMMACFRARSSAAFTDTSEAHVHGSGRPRGFARLKQMSAIVAEGGKAADSTDCKRQCHWQIRTGLHAPSKSFAASQLHVRGQGPRAADLTDLMRHRCSELARSWHNDAPEAQPAATWSSASYAHKEGKCTSRCQLLQHVQPT